MNEGSAAGSALFQSHFSFKTIETWCLYSAVGTQEWKCFAIGQWGKLRWFFLLLLLFCTTWLKYCSKPLVTAHHLSTEKSRWFDALGRHTFLTRLLCAWLFVTLSPEHVMLTQIHSFSMWCCLQQQTPWRVFPREFDSLTAPEEIGSMSTLLEYASYWWQQDWVLCQHLHIHLMGNMQVPIWVCSKAKISWGQKGWLESQTVLKSFIQLSVLWETLCI